MLKDIINAHAKLKDSELSDQLLQDLSAVYLGKPLPSYSRQYASQYDAESLLWLSIRAAKQERLGFSVFQVFYVGREPKHLAEVESFVFGRLIQGDAPSLIESHLRCALSCYQLVLMQHIKQESES